MGCGGWLSGGGGLTKEGRIKRRGKLSWFCVLGNTKCKWCGIKGDAS